MENDNFKQKDPFGGVPREVWNRPMNAGFGEAKKIIKEWLVEERARIREVKRLERIAAKEKLRQEKADARQARRDAAAKRKATPKYRREGGKA